MNNSKTKSGASTGAAQLIKSIIWPYATTTEEDCFFNQLTVQYCVSFRALPIISDQPKVWPRK